MIALLVILGVVVAACVAAGIAYHLRPAGSPASPTASPESVFRAERYAEHIRHQVATARTAEQLFALSVRNRRLSARAADEGEVRS